MEQNINLLISLPGRRTVFLESKDILQVVTLFIVVLAVTSGVNWWLNSVEQKKIKGIELQKKELTSKIEQITKQISAIKEEPTIVHEAISIKSSQAMSLSRYLLDLAKYTPEGVWLTELNFLQPNDIIILKGVALSASLIPLFLNTLNKSEDFGKKKFGTLQLQKVEDSNQVKFTLSTVTEIAPIVNPEKK